MLKLSKLNLFSKCIKLMKGKALRKHSLHEKTAASVLLKLFISSNEWCMFKSFFHENVNTNVD